MFLKVVLIKVIAIMKASLKQLDFAKKVMT